MDGWHLSSALKVLEHQNTCYAHAHTGAWTQNPLLLSLLPQKPHFQYKSINHQQKHQLKLIRANKIIFYCFHSWPLHPFRGVLKDHPYQHHYYHHHHHHHYPRHCTMLILLGHVTPIMWFLWVLAWLMSLNGGHLWNTQNSGLNRGSLMQPLNLHFKEKVFKCVNLLWGALD